MTTPTLSLICMAFAMPMNSASAAETDTLRMETKINDVTVFFSGAQVSRAGKLNLTQGTHTLAVQYLPAELDGAKIQATAPEGATILSVKHLPQRISHKEKPATQKALEDKIESQKQRIKTLKSEMAVFDIEERIMIDNSRLGTREGVSAVEEIRAAADLYRSRLNEIRKAKMARQVEVDAVNEDLKVSFAAFNKLNYQRQRPYSEIVITMECRKPVSDQLALSYYVPSAGWEPLYDFRVSDTKNPLSLVYNANVYQSTGEDWKNVLLTLSSVNPQAGTERPQLDPWLISYRKKVAQQAATEGTGSLMGKVRDADTNEPLPFVNVVVLQNGQLINGISSDFDGRFHIKPINAGTYKMVASYLGYQTMEINAVQVSTQKITFQDFRLQASEVSLEEFEVVEYSQPLIDKDGGASGGVMSRRDIQNMPVRSAKNSAANVGGMANDKQEEQVIYLNLDQYDSEDFIANSTAVNVANLEYTIEVPFTVLSDGRDYQLKIKEVRVPASYLYHAVPKLNPAAYLTANLSDWSQLNLLSGTASIYFKGTFTGNTYLDASQTIDTLTLSLGPDKSVVVQRTGRKELKEKSIIGGNVRESQSWNLSLRNNRQETVKVVLYDQYPISELKAVQVNLGDHDGARSNEKTGELKWEIELEPGARVERNFSYELRYPQGNAALLK